MRHLKARLFLIGSTLGVVAACALLGVWQLNRLSERKAYNSSLVTKSRLETVPLPGLDLSESSYRSEYSYRRVGIQGEYDDEREIVLRARSNNGRAGNHLLVPMRLGDGSYVLVDRGWVPFEIDQPRSDRTAPPRIARGAGILAPSEPARKERAGTLATIGSIDLARIQKQLPYAIRRYYVALESQEPAQAGGLPIPVGLPAPGEGPHFAYAVQWFIFGAVAAATGLILYRREPKSRAEGG